MRVCILCIAAAQRLLTFSNRASVLDCTPSLAATCKWQSEVVVQSVVDRGLATSLPNWRLDTLLDRVDADFAQAMDDWQKNHPSKEMSKREQHLLMMFYITRHGTDWNTQLHHDIDILNLMAATKCDSEIEDLGKHCGYHGTLVWLDACNARATLSK